MTGPWISSSQGVQIGDGNVQHNNFGAPVPQPPPPPSNTILMVMANPWGTAGLRLDEEHRAVTRAVQAGRHRERLAVVSAQAARYYDFSSLIQLHRPVVVHFAGHGSDRGEFVMTDGHGEPVTVPIPALADTFRNHRSTVRCVVLNGCATRPQAEAIAAHVPFVVGTSAAIPDALAIEFAAGFYTAVANGATFAAAYAEGCNRIDLGGYGSGDTVVLVTRRRGRSSTAIS